MVALGGGPSRTLQAENQGEEANYVGAVSIDGTALYTSLAGFRQANAFTRFSLEDDKKSVAHAFVSLSGPYARDRGRQYYAEQPAGLASDCGAGGGMAPCLVVSGDDPFGAAPRTLPVQLALAIAPQPAFTDTPPSATVTATRRTVSPTAVIRTDPMSGLPVELLTGRIMSAAPGAATPSGATATTRAGGTATIAIPGTPVPRLAVGAIADPAEPAGSVAVQTPDTTLLQTFVHLTATPQRLPDGRLQITGTITPAQPGRKVKLDRRIQRVCEHVVSGGSAITPSTAATPPGCLDHWSPNPIATAAVSPDGASYSITAATPAGVYRVSLDFAGGADVFAGETDQITAP